MEASASSTFVQDLGRGWRPFARKSEEWPRRSARRQPPHNAELVMPKRRAQFRRIFEPSSISLAKGPSTAAQILKQNVDWARLPLCNLDATPRTSASTSRIQHDDPEGLRPQPALHNQPRPRGSPYTEFSPTPNESSSLLRLPATSSASTAFTLSSLGGATSGADIGGGRDPGSGAASPPLPTSPPSSRQPWAPVTKATAPSFARTESGAAGSPLRPHQPLRPSKAFLPTPPGRRRETLPRDLSTVPPGTIPRIAEKLMVWPPHQSRTPASATAHRAPRPRPSTDAPSTERTETRQLSEPPATPLLRPWSPASPSPPPSARSRPPKRPQQRPLQGTLGPASVPSPGLMITTRPWPPSKREGPASSLLLRRGRRPQTYRKARSKTKLTTADPPPRPP